MCGLALNEARLDLDSLIADYKLRKTRHDIRPRDEDCRRAGHLFSWPGPELPFDPVD